MDRGVILKRGYLYDKKVGILPMTVDRKRWYVLRQETSAGGGSQGRVILEIYKDEKAVSKGDSPKGCIDIRNVVSTQRVMAGKKQSFEILCPGIGYRLMANSELEADEWTQTIQRHILYKRDAYSSSSSSSSSFSPSTPGLVAPSAAMKTLSLNRVQSHPIHTHPHHGHHMSNLVHERQLTGSNLHTLVGVSGTSHPPYHPHQYFHGHQQQHQPVPIVLPHQQRGFVQISHSLPTPPHSVSPPSFPTYRFSPIPGTSFQRQRSTEIGPPSSLASPSTSSDSSSLCSSSNTSFEGGGGQAGVFEVDGLELRSSFRVQVNDSENLNLVGTVDLVVNEDGLRLHSLPPDQRELVFWPLGSLRKYGNSNFCFTIITGRFCATGEGVFQFSTEEGRLIQAKLHSYVTQKASRGRSSSRRASEPESCGRSPQHTALPLNHSFPASHFSSPPPYCTDQTHEYSRLQHFLPPHVGKGLVTQPIPIVSQVPNLPYIHSRTQTPPLLPQKPHPISPDSNLSPIPCDKELSRSSPDSVRNSSPSQSQSDQNQTLPGTCALSERSSSASDSGCPSELPGLASDHEYEIQS